MYACLVCMCYPAAESGMSREPTLADTTFSLKLKPLCTSNSADTRKSTGALPI